MPKKAKAAGRGEGGGRREEEKLPLQKTTPEENVKKREEAFTRFMQDKLQKEEREAAVNMRKVNEGWRSILLQTRDEKLRNEVIVAKQTFEREVDHLDSVIQVNLRSVWLRRGRQRYLQNAERLRAQHARRVTSLQQQRRNVLQKLVATLSSERDQMSTNMEQRRAVLEDAKFMLDQHHQDEMTATHKLYKDIITAHNVTHDDMMAKLSLEESETMEESETKEESETMDKEVLGAEQSAQELDADAKRVEQLQGLIRKQKELNQSARAEHQLKEQEMKEAIAQVKQKTSELRKNLKQSKAAAKKQLTDLVVHGNKAIEKLHATSAKGERVLRRMEICRKLEVKCGLVFPPEEQRPESTGPEVEEPEAEASEFAELRPLTRRLNWAALQLEGLKKHRDDLRSENKELKLQLRQHLAASPNTPPKMLIRGTKPRPKR
ncbi:dynein regulatory complex subunit 2 [Brachionichthys hirsutus]|uniref:dynein regulatory complex subunit 2 n=1 Tax=Brachionichthys hirsutus TaxID=412623 RepID=UPI003604DF66